MRKMLTATIVAMVLFAVGAFAATFTLTAEDVASGADEVRQCASQVDVTFDTAYDTTLGNFKVTAVKAAVTPNGSLSCVGARFEVKLLKLDGGDATGSPFVKTALVAGDLPNVSFTPTSTLPVSEITRAAVLIDGFEVSTGDSGTP